MHELELNWNGNKTIRSVWSTLFVSFSTSAPVAQRNVREAFAGVCLWKVFWVIASKADLLENNVFRVVHQRSANWNGIPVEFHLQSHPYRKVLSMFQPLKLRRNAKCDWDGNSTDAGVRRTAEGSRRMNQTDAGNRITYRTHIRGTQCLPGGLRCSRELDYHCF